MFLARRSASYIQHPAWYRAYFQCGHESPAALSFLAVRRDSALVAVFPVAYRRRSGILRRAGLPISKVITATDCCIAEGENGAEIWRFVREGAQSIEGCGWDVFAAGGRGHLASSDIHSCLHGNHRLTLRTPHVESCATLRVRDYAEVQGTLSKKFRYSLRRGHRELEQLGTTRFRICAGADDVADGLEAFVRLEQAGWKGNADSRRAGYNNGAAIANTEWKLTFFRHFVQEMAADSLAEICQVLVGEQLVGSQLTFVIGDTAYVLKTTYDENIKDASIGHLMLENSLQRYACDHSTIRTINLVSNYPWVRKWRPDVQPYYRLSDFRATPSGVAGAARARLRSYFNARPSTR